MENNILKQEIPTLGSRVTLTYEQPIVVFQSKLLGNISMGAYSYCNQDTVVYNSNIGRFTSIAHKVMIAPTEHPVNWLSTSGFAFGDKNVFRHFDAFNNIFSDEFYDTNKKRTDIGNDVWIGYGVFIKRGVTIGDGAIIAAHATVVNDVPPYAIVGGTPAKIIKMRFDENTINRLKKLKWWEYFLDREVIGNICYSNIDYSLNTLETLVADNKLKKLTPVKITTSYG